MLNKLKNSSLFRTTSIYTLANIINAAIPFFLMPVLTRYLSPLDYGIVTLLQLLVSFCNPFISLQMNGAISIKYFQKDKIYFPKYVSSCLIVIFIATIFVGAFFYFFNQQISSFTQFPIDWLWTVVVICISQVIINIFLAILRVSIQPKKFGVIVVSQTILNVVLTIWLVVFLNLAWEGRIIAQLVTTIVYGILSILLMYVNRWVIFSFDFNYIKDALKFGVPLIPHVLAGFAMVMADRIIITELVGISYTGIYTIGAQIGMAIGLLEDSFNQAYSPWLYDKLRSITYETKVKIVKFTYLYMIVIILIAIIFSCFISFVWNYMVGKEFYDSNNVVLWIALGYAFSGMYKMVANYIFYVEKTYFLAATTFFVAILHIGITYLCVLKFGVIGAGYATTISYFLVFIFTWILSAKVYPMPWLDVLKKMHSK